MTQPWESPASRAFEVKKWGKRPCFDKKTVLCPLKGPCILSFFNLPAYYPGLYGHTGVLFTALSTHNLWLFNCHETLSIQHRPGAQWPPPPPSRSSSRSTEDTWYSSENPPFGSLSMKRQKRKLTKPPAAIIKKNWLGVTKV